MARRDDRTIRIALVKCLIFAYIFQEQFLVNGRAFLARRAVG
jgi:hypothetical protein